MTTITRLFGLSIAVACLSTTAQGQSWDFQYGFLDVYSPNALDYVVGQVNIQRSSEGNPENGISYWNPIANGTEARLTLEFTFPRPTTEISLFSSIGAWNFGGGNFGSGSLWASMQVSVLTSDTKARPAEFVERFGETQWAACSSWGILISTLRKCQ